jgi:hypothetical protein
VNAMTRAKRVAMPAHETGVEMHAALCHASA